MEFLNPICMAPNMTAFTSMKILNIYFVLSNEMVMVGIGRIHLQSKIIVKEFQDIG